jgi:hypothetical protein
MELHHERMLLADLEVQRRRQHRRAGGGTGTGNAGGFFGDQIRNVRLK